ncbi:putative nucleotide-diphospho-sugar transferase [Neobacillus vireti]|uniref:putative nucleotide-diphospho-sugar transferase n=1 Tax=Neobacillus vireti TaxID=220686 RepID=UPI002FFF7302
MESVYCTIMTKSRLYQFLALISSLNKVRAGEFRFHVLCVDKETYNLLKKLNWDHVIATRDKELGEDILALKKERRIHEYCWSLKALWLETIFQKNPEVMRVTFMDSDLYFWDDPELIFNVQPDCSVLLSREEKYHPEWKGNFVKRLKRLTGEYNSGFISFKRDKMGTACLAWWREKTLEACRIDPRKGIFGDQRYLNEMPKLFSNICDITTAGVNVGIWNYRKYTFFEKNGQVFIDRTPLIFYHFSGVRVINQDNKVELVHGTHENTPFVFTIYQNILTQLVTKVREVEPLFDGFATKEDLQKYW